MKNKIINPILLGTIIFLLQLFLIISISSNQNLFSAWLDLASHWDSEWYEAIAKFGYINIDGPQNTGLQNANVVFFPGYPYLARLMIKLFSIKAKVALLIIAQFFAYMFWILIFIIIQKSTWFKQLIAVTLIMFFPTSWFLFTGYAESNFLFATCLMLWLFLEKKWLLSGFSALYMSATRIIGVPVLIVPTLVTIICNHHKIKEYITKRNFSLIFRMLNKSYLIGIIGILGCLSFLIYCQIKFGSWHLYFDMEKSGWQGSADPFFIFKIPTWLPPPFGYNLDLTPPLPNAHNEIFNYKFFRLAAYSLSEIMVPMFLWICIIYSIFICKKNKLINGLIAKLSLELREDHDDSNIDSIKKFASKSEVDKKSNEKSLTYFLAAILIFLFNCLSLSTRHYESMSRCLYPVWVLLILSDILHPNGILLFRLEKLKLSIATVAICCIYGGFWLQLLNRFYLGWWVA